MCVSHAIVMSIFPLAIVLKGQDCVNVAQNFFHLTVMTVMMVIMIIRTVNPVTVIEVAPWEAYVKWVVASVLARKTMKD